MVALFGRVLVAYAASCFAFTSPAARPALRVVAGRAPLTIAHGIPKMFRWLTDQYPSIMERVSDGLPEDGDEDRRVDNLYLDMNGIIHPCTHSNEPELTTMSEKEMFVRIFTFTDKLCKIVKPREFIFLAVDGVAPRAKMNQQRARRFRSAMEREELLKSLHEAEGDNLDVIPEGYDSASLDASAFDSNCITPGTEFMDRLAIAFRAWLQHKVETDPFWKQPRVLFSGPDIPGEGEHKVMEYIRRASAMESWSPELRHCFYGLDADLIMLSLVTHQTHFRLLREKMSVRHARPGRKPKDPLQYAKYDYELLEVGLLREMIELTFRTKADTKYELERLVDDFVFICMLVGNDFLPQMPHLDIVDGSLDLMMSTYRELLPVMGGHITDKEQIHLPRLELLCRALATFEAPYFARRGALEGVKQFADEEQYAAHYYWTKFGLAPDDKAGRKALAKEYVLGLYWCVQYYHKGVESWDWFYPHLYAPLASDLRDLASLNFDFPSDQSRPFTPLMQLLSVLPPQSSRLLPRPYAELMTEPASPLASNYPPTFKVDQNGKTAPWEAIVLIPFLEEDTMIAELSRIDHTEQLTTKERFRNDINNAKYWHSDGKFKPTDWEKLVWEQRTNTPPAPGTTQANAKPTKATKA